MPEENNFSTLRLKVEKPSIMIKITKNLRNHLTAT